MAQTNLPPVFLVAALPPLKGDAALLGHLIARDISADRDVICLADDTSIDPLPIHTESDHQISFMRVRDFRRAAQQYEKSPRLFVLDDGFDSLFALELYLEYAGVAVLASSGLHESVKALLREQGDWPQNYIAHLNTAFDGFTGYKTVGRAILKTLFDGRRHSNALLGVTPFLHVLGKDANLLALSDEQENFLARENIQSHRCHLGVGTSETSCKDAKKSLFGDNTPNLVVSVTSQGELDTTRRALTDAVTHNRKIAVINLSEAHDPYTALLASDIVAASSLVTRPIASILRDFSRANGKPYIDFDQPGASAKLASLVSLKCAGQDLSYITPGDQNTYAKISQTIGSLPIPVIDAQAVMQRTKTTTTPVTPSTKLPKDARGKALIIGSAPGPAILAAAVPSLETEAAPRIATQAFAEALGNALGIPAKTALDRMGFEGLVIGTKSNPTSGANHTLSSVKSMLHQVDHLCAASPEIADAEAIPMLPMQGVQFGFSFPHGKPTHEYDTWSYSPSMGLAWRIDPHRRVVHFILLLGGFKAQLSLSDPEMAHAIKPNGRRTINFVFAGHRDSQTLVDKPITLTPNSAGIYKGRIAAHVPDEAVQLDADKTLKLLQSLPFTIRFVESDMGGMDNDNQNDQTLKETIMTSLNATLADSENNDLPPLPVPDKRLTNDAVRYTDILLETQRKQSEAYLRLITDEQALATPPQKSKNRETHVYPENPDFAGTGWSNLAESKSGTCYRWMPRMATVLVDIDLSTGGEITVEGYGVNRRRFLKALNVYIGNTKLDGAVKRTGLQTWEFKASVPNIEDNSFLPPYQILRFENKGAAIIKKGRYLGDLRLSGKDQTPTASLGISRIEIKSRP